VTSGFNALVSFTGGGGHGPSGLEAKYDIYVFRCVGLITFVASTTAAKAFASAVHLQAAFKSEHSTNASHVGR
jgi:hypothetical protein